MVKVIIPIFVTILVVVVIILGLFGFGVFNEKYNVGASNETGLLLLADIEYNVTQFEQDRAASFDSQFKAPKTDDTSSQVKSARSSDTRCGKQLFTYDDRIVGGKVATIAEFPWMISLQREKSFWFGFKAYYHSCGGSLLTPSWIITAAHCLYNKDDVARAVAGADNMNFLYRAQLRSINKFIMHPEFDITTYDNDIALLKVSRPFNLESTFSHVSAICFERDVIVEPYDIATVAGFGANAFHEKSRHHLYKTDIAIIDQRVCNESFDYKITNNMLCAGGMISNKRDACTGDSGGPLELEVGGHYSLIGLVSFGNDCATEGYPGVYTRVQRYYDWVLSHLDEPLFKP